MSVLGVTPIASIWNPSEVSVLLKTSGFLFLKASHNDFSLAVSFRSSSFLLIAGLGFALLPFADWASFFSPTACARVDDVSASKTITRIARDATRVLFIV